MIYYKNVKPMVRLLVLKFQNQMKKEIQPMELEKYL